MIRVFAIIASVAPSTVRPPAMTAEHARVRSPMLRRILAGVTSFLFIAALAAGVPGTARTRTATREAAPPTEHLYVAVEAVSGCCGGPRNFIYRYPLHGWTIGPKPDLVYDGYAGPIAFDAKGNLYAGKGSLNWGATYNIWGFHRGENLPFAKFSGPPMGQFTYVTAMAIDPRGFLVLGYVFYYGSSYPADVAIATYRMSDDQLINGAVIATYGSKFYAPGVTGIALDAQHRLYVSVAGEVVVFRSVATAKLTKIGEIKGTAFHNPGGLVIDPSRTLYAVDLPAPGKATISSYAASSRGIVAPESVLTPAGRDDSLLICCGSMGPVLLAYQTSIVAQRLYMPFFYLNGNGGSVTGVYEFNKAQSGRSRAIAALVAATVPPGNTPYVAEAAAVGP